MLFFSTCRPDALILADAVSQGADSRLMMFQPDEQNAGKSHFGFIVAAMPLDAWIVVAVLALMMRHFRDAAGAPLDYLADPGKGAGSCASRVVAVAAV